MKQLKQLADEKELPERADLNKKLNNAEIDMEAKDVKIKVRAFLSHDAGGSRSGHFSYTKGASQGQSISLTQRGRFKVRVFLLHEGGDSRSEHFSHTMVAGQGQGISLTYLGRVKVRAFLSHDGVGQGQSISLTWWGRVKVRAFLSHGGGGSRSEHCSHNARERVI